MNRHHSSQPLELEIKFRLAPGAQAALDREATLQSDRKARHEVTTYFDTGAGTLAREGASLRVRCRCGERVQTLKLRGKGDGPFGRGEWEWLVSSERPEPELLMDTPAAAFAECRRSAESGLCHRCAARCQHGANGRSDNRGGGRSGPGDRRQFRRRDPRAGTRTEGWRSSITLPACGIIACQRANGAWRGK